MFGRHKAPNPYFATRVGDTWFGECPSCLRDVVMHDGGKWQEVPVTQRVRWDRGRPSLVDRTPNELNRQLALRQHGLFARLREAVMIVLRP